MDGGKDHFFHMLCIEWNFYLNVQIEHGTLPINELVVHRKEGHNWSYHVPKRPTVKKKSHFWCTIFKFQNKLEQKTSNLWAFLRQTVLWEPNRQEMCKYFFRHSESCEQCGDIGTWVGRWSKWNGGLTIRSHIFHDKWELFSRVAREKDTF